MIKQKDDIYHLKGFINGCYLQILLFLCVEKYLGRIGFILRASRYVFLVH
jgi:hypothetical protein